MIQGFEEQTPDILPKDMPKVRMIASGISKRVGKENAITNREIREGFNVNRGEQIGGAFVRKAIQFIRMQQMVPYLVASPKGYYVARTREEFEEYVESYRQRIRAMQATLQAMEKDMNPQTQDQ